MKQWCVLLLILAIAVAVFGCGTLEPEPTQELTEMPTEEPTVLPTEEPGVEAIPLEGLECLVRIWMPAGSGGGADVSPYVYYAIRENGVEEVDVEAVKQVAPEMVIGEGYGSHGFVNEGVTQWFAQLIYMPRVELFDGSRFARRNDPWLPTEFGENIRIYYRVWSGEDREAGPEIESVMLQAAYAFHDGDPEKWIGRGGGPDDDFSRILTSFLLTYNAETLFVENREDNLYRPMEDGTFQLVMEMPDESSYITYYWFPPK